MEQMRDFDFVMFERDVQGGLGYLAQDFLSALFNGPAVAGFAATATAPASLTVNIGAGRIYAAAAADATAVGSIPQDLTVFCQQGLNAGQAITLTPPSTGQSQWNLIQCQFSQVDAVRANDPNGGVVPFYNPGNPAVPTNTSINTVRQSLCILQVITGSPATTGSEVPPQPTSGWTPLYLIDMTGGQTSISAGQVLAAGPSVGTGVPTNYPVAPFIAGFFRSHHSGAYGQAPKIDLTKEVTGILPYANMAPTRQVLTSNLAIYVSTTGNDLNNGLAPASAFLTIQAAINSVYRNYDFNGKNCTINCANGTYTVSGSPGDAAARFTGLPTGMPAGGLSLIGNIASPGSVTIAASNCNAIIGQLGAYVTVQGFTITATGTTNTPLAQQGAGVISTSGAWVSIYNCVIGSCGTAQLQVMNGAVLTTNGQPITLTGTTQVSFDAVGSGGLLYLSGSTITCSSLTASIAIAGAQLCGVINFTSVTFVGSATGTRYSASLNAVITTTGGGATFIPGSVSGVTATGGQYN